MRRWIRGVVAVVASVSVNGVAIAGAVPTRSWPVTPGALGSLYGTVDADGFASLRIWGPAAWCYLQPTEDADVEANLERQVAPELDQVEEAGGSAVLTIGHPAPWVFENHKKAVARPKLWACGDHASGRAIPSPKSLRPNEDGTPSVQTQRYRDYVSRIVDFLAERYEGNVPITLQAWNEPNIPAGLEPGMKIPGAAQTVKEAAASLYAFDAIMYDVVRSKGATSWLTVGSSTTILRWDPLTKAYFAAHNKKRRIDEIHFNLYSYDVRNVDAAVAKWDKRAGLATSVRKRYPKLRSLPIRLSEVNLNLINDPRQLNLRKSFANDAAQRRMATATQMNAYYHGIQSLYWLIPWRKIQTAVHVSTEPGNPAHDSLVTLQNELLGTTFTGCRQSRKVRTCTFRAIDGSRRYVIWRNSGTSTIRSPRSGERLEVTGVVHPLRSRERLRIGTTPVVLRPAAPVTVTPPVEEVGELVPPPGVTEAVRR